MICIVDKRKRFIVYLLNLFGLFFYPLIAILRKKWSKSHQNELESLIVNRSFNNICINLTARLGDIVLLIPFIRALKKQFNHSKLIILTNNIGKDILQNSPYVDEIILVYIPWSGSTNTNFGEFIKSLCNIRYWSQMKSLRNKKVDAVIEVIGDFRNIILFDIWLNADYFLGQTFSGFGWLFDREIIFAKGSHEIDNKLNIAKALGARSLDRKLEFYLTNIGRQEAKLFYEINKISNDLVVIFHLGGTWEKRIWPLSNFARIAQKLIEIYKAKIILIGDSRDKDKIDKFLEIVPGAIRADGLRVSQSAAILEKADLFIGNDSGPMHLARSVGTPIVAIFGPELPWRTGIEEAGVTIINSFPCQPCGQTKCDKKPNCIESITIEQVWDGIELILKQKRHYNHRHLTSDHSKSTDQSGLSQR